MKNNAVIGMVYLRDKPPQIVDENSGKQVNKQEHTFKIIKNDSPCFLPA